MLLLFFVLGSCSDEYRYCNCKTTDEQLHIYSDVMNELVERRFYNLYLGKDEERIFKAQVEQPADSVSIRRDVIRLQNEIYRDTLRLCVLYLDTIMTPRFNNQAYYEADTGKYSKQFIDIISSVSGNTQAVIDSLNQVQTKYAPAGFSLCTSRLLPITEVDKHYADCEIGILRISKLVMNEERTRGILYYEFRCGRQCGKGELLVIGKYNNRWHICESVRSWVS